MFFRCPLIWILLAHICGLLCPVIPAPPVKCLTFGLLMAGLAAAAAAVRLQGRSGSRLAAASLLLAGAAGLIQGNGAATTRPRPVSLEQDWFTGRVFGRPLVNSRDTVLLVDLELTGSAPGSTRIRLTYPTATCIPGSSPDLLSGQRIRFFTTLRRPTAFGNPGSFDYLRYLTSRGVRFTARLKSGQLVQRVTETPSDTAATIRCWVERTAWTRYGGGQPPGLRPPGALLVACLVGERRWIDPQMEELLYRSGLGHLLAISGLHVGLLGLVLTRLLAGMRAPIRIRRLLLIVFLASYHELCGGTPSITRAVITAVVFLSGGTLGLHPRPLNSLAAAALAILAVNPLMLHDSGFQLSFGATCSILLLGPVLIRPCRSRTARLLWSLPAVSAAVVLGIAPLQALLFHRATPASLLTNPAAGPLLGLSLTAGLVFLATRALCSCDWLPACGSLLLETVSASAADVVDGGFFAILWLARQSSPLSFRLPAPAPAVACGYYFCLAAAVLLSRREKRAWHGRAVLLLLCFAPSLMLVGATITGCRLPGGMVRVTVLDVGQGDATIIECPGRRTLVIDGGGALAGNRFDFGEMVVSPALWDRGLHSVEKVAVSHGHQDHAGGLSSVVRNFRPQRILAGRLLSTRLSAVRSLMATAEECGAGLAKLHRGMVVRHGEVELLVLHPPPPLPYQAAKEARGPNNNSLVLLLCHREIRMLFTGDLEQEGEEALLCSPLSRLIGGCALLKVGHHGAPDANSKHWLQLVSPRTAVITAGRFNRFGHPDPLLRHKLHEAGCRRIHCTGHDGALVVVSDGRRLYHRTGPF